jgi:hypothetical protein
MLMDEGGFCILVVELRYATIDGKDKVSEIAACGRGRGQ